MTGVASTTVYAHQASVGVTASARMDPVSRQGEYWPVGAWAVTGGAGGRREGKQERREGGGEELGLRVRSPTREHPRIKPQAAKVSLVQGFSIFGVPFEPCLQHQRSVGAGGTPRQCVTALVGEVGVGRLRT